VSKREIRLANKIPSNGTYQPLPPERPNSTGWTFDPRTNRNTSESVTRRRAGVIWNSAIRRGRAFLRGFRAKKVGKQSINRHIVAMEHDPAEIAIARGSAAASAAATAFVSGHVLHYGIGFSLEDIRFVALVSAIFIAVPLAIEYFSRKLRKPN
jgi:hypothetical protein